MPRSMPSDLIPERFLPAAIAEETRLANENLARKIAATPPLADLAKLRARFVSGEGAIPNTPRSPRAKTLNVSGIPLRVIAPPSPTGVYLHFHGGGWTLGAADMRDGDLELIVESTGLACISVEYRLAPEHPYPAGPDDCETAARWLIEHAKEHFGSTHLLIGGESAGAHLAVVTLLRLRKAGLGDAYRAANLIFGAYDLGGTPSMLASETTLITNRNRLLMATAAFLPPGTSLRDPDVSPLYADLRGLPPALFTIGTLDPFLDDSLFMHARWIAAGNASELAVYPGGVHGFTAFPGSLTDQANARMLAFIRAADASRKTV